MSVETLQDLFEHGLEDIYHAEHELLECSDSGKLLRKGKHEHHTNQLCALIHGTCRSITSLTYYVEQLEENTDREEIAQEFADHRSETEDQIDRLEQVFEAFGESPEKEECEGIKGIIEEYRGSSLQTPTRTSWIITIWLPPRRPNTTRLQPTET